MVDPAGEDNPNPKPYGELPASMPSNAAVPTNEVISDYFPMSREELGVPAIPLIRLGVAETAESARTVPQPHAVFSTEKPQRSAEFTVAARAKAAALSAPATSPTTRPLPQVDRGNDVRFVIRQKESDPSLPEMVHTAIAPTTANGAALQASDYPYWLVALFQIVLGTIVVILVVKLANLNRESTSGPTRQVMTPSQPSPAETVASRAATWLGSHAIGNTGSESPGHGY